MFNIEGKEVRTKGKLVRVAHLDGEGYEFVEDPEAAIKNLRESGKWIDLFTFIPRLSEVNRKYPYPTEADNMAVIEVSTFDNWMTNQLGSKARNMVRKASKSGVEVREVPYDDEFVRGIWSVYNESPIRQGMRFWHYGKDLETVRRINATFMDQSIFIGAYLEGNLIGFIKMVTEANRAQAGLMQIVSMIKHRDKAPTNALVAQAVRSCADRGIPYLWYASMTYGNKPEDSLAEFKRHNGFVKFDLPRYYIPLTAAGRLALNTGLHRSMLELIPEPVIAYYRNLRASWYAKKFPVQKA